MAGVLAQEGGEILGLQGRAEQEALALLEAHQASEEQIPPLLLRARLLQGLNRGEDALPLLEKGIERHPDDKRLRLAYARKLATTQRYSEAYELLEKALRLKPDDAAIIDSMGWLHYRTGKYPDALNLLRQAYEAAPNAEIGAHLGEVLWVIGDKEEARRIWREAQQREPDSDTIRETLDRLKADL